ncbi:penicillin-binding protein [Arachnia propionica]|uniref:Penicillin-binding protein n=1 Tax=Arachnia propionica TaxID=1750 RepID=A0A3P1T510_9ACTN|nr:transglycosylase domain-containing protein [Arachnia propionica]MDO5083627.1 transglycosylase domain-containing protein [Arachnia propionica]RRD04255.1 penicillin-binding protein [Arachnia propionica]
MSEEKKKPKARRSKSRARKILGRIALGFVALLIVLGLTGVGTFFYLYSTTKLPDPNSDFTTNTTFLYYDDGSTQLGSLAVQNRVTLTYAEMPQVVKDAVIAAENSSFFTDPGFSLTGMARGMWSIARGGEVQGGSTITQQYIKILYLNSERSAQRKIRELILAIKMGREVPKEQILEGYLNTIYFGRGAYGIEAAAKSYFLKPAAELSLAEAATLAAILNNPAGFNPSGGDKHRERLLGRYQYVLKQMLAEGYITQAEHDANQAALPEFPEVPKSNRYGGPKGFLITQIESELDALGFSEEQVQGGGLHVTSTINEAMQNSAVETAQKYTEQAAADASTPQDPAQLHIGIASVDTGTGGVLALYGGPDYVENSRNWATTPRPAASTFKTFAAVAGLRNGYSLDSILKGDTFTPRGDPKPVRNEFSHQYGDVTLRRSIAESINTAFVDMTQEIKDGPQEVIKAANDAGAPEGPGWDPNNRIALGAAEVSPLNMANAYATLADGGKYKPTHFVAKVTDRHGNILYEAKQEPAQNIDANVAANVTDALTSVVEEGTGKKASALKRPVAGKTGTNGVGDDITSAWFVGYTRQVSTAVMYVAGDSGNEDLDPYKRPQDKTFFGSSYPLMTWVDHMTTVSEGMEVLDFDAPKKIDGRSASPSPSSTVVQPEQPTETETPTESPTEVPTGGQDPEPVPTTQAPTREPSREPSETPREPRPTKEPTQSEAPRPSRTPTEPAPEPSSTNNEGENE